MTEPGRASGERSGRQGQGGPQRRGVRRDSSGEGVEGSETDPRAAEPRVTVRGAGPREWSLDDSGGGPGRGGGGEGEGVNKDSARGHRTRGRLGTQASDSRPRPTRVGDERQSRNAG